jgi:hypothetical protein
MRRFPGMAVLILAFLGVQSSPAQDKAPPADEKVVLEPGKNITATFHPFNVTARIAVKEEPEEEDEAARKRKTKAVPYTTKNKYHCLITEYDLDPVVMLFVQGSLEDNAAFRGLLQKIDTAIDRNPGVRMHCFVVFIGDYKAGHKDDKEDTTVTDDAKRDEDVKKVQKLADDLMLKQVVLTLASKSDVAKYPLDPATALTSVLYKTLRIAAVHKTPLDKLDKADGDAVNAIMKDVAGKLKATR